MTKRCQLPSKPLPSCAFTSTSLLVTFQLSKNTELCRPELQYTAARKTVSGPEIHKDVGFIAHTPKIDKVLKLMLKDQTWVPRSTWRSLLGEFNIQRVSCAFLPYLCHLILILTFFFISLFLIPILISSPRQDRRLQFLKPGSKTKRKLAAIPVPDICCGCLR